MLSCKFPYVGGIRSLAVSVRSVPLYGFAAGSSELVIRNFPAAGIQATYLYLFPTSWHQLVASQLLSTSFQQVTLDRYPARSYQCVTCLSSTTDKRHIPRSCFTPESFQKISNRFILHGFLQIPLDCIHRPHLGSLQMSHQHVCSCARSRLSSMQNFIHSAAAIPCHS